MRTQNTFGSYWGNWSGCTPSTAANPVQSFGKRSTDLLMRAKGWRPVLLATGSWPRRCKGRTPSRQAVLENESHQGCRRRVEIPYFPQSTASQPPCRPPEPWRSGPPCRGPSSGRRIATVAVDAPRSMKDCADPTRQLWSECSSTPTAAVHFPHDSPEPRWCSFVAAFSGSTGGARGPRRGCGVKPVVERRHRRRREVARRHPRLIRL